MKYLHTMVRVTRHRPLSRVLLRRARSEEVRRHESEAGRFTLVFLRRRATSDGQEVELTYNWDPEPYGDRPRFGHLAYEVDDIYAACQRLPITA